MNANTYRSCSLTAGAAIAVVLGLHGIAQAATPSVAASAWPNKPIRIIVGTTPGSPPDIVARLNREFVAALKTNELRQRLRPEAFEALGSTPEYLGDYMKKEIARWAKLVKETGAKID